MKYETVDLKPRINDLVHGRCIESVTACDNLLVIRCTDGVEVRVAWVDPNGEPVNGQVAVRYYGLNVLAKTAVLFGKGQGA